MTTYIIRTRTGRDVYAFDDLSRARAERTRSEKRLGIALRIVEVVRTEREVA